MVVTDICLRTGGEDEDMKSADKFFHENFASFCKRNETEMTRCKEMANIPVCQEGRQIMSRFMRLSVSEYS